MVEGWNDRLRESRRKKGYSLGELQGMDKLDMSQQSLIKYKKGEVFPRIDVLEKMCKLYGTTIDYVLYGNDKLGPFENKSNSLVTLFMLLYSGKMKFDGEGGTIKIVDPVLRYQIGVLDCFRTEADISSIDDINRLVEGIKKLQDE